MKQIKTHLKDQRLKNKDQRVRYKRDIVILAQRFSINFHRFLKKVDSHLFSKHLILQSLRSSTSICANIIEAQSNSSKKNLAFKYSISLKEARETYYWLTMLQVEFPEHILELKKLKKQLSEIIAITTSITKKLSSQIKIFLIFSLYSLFFLNSLKVVNAVVRLSEVYPAPLSGEHEWIELYNDSTESASLANWTLEDQLSSPSVIHTFLDEVIESESYRVIELLSSKLNNSADGVILKDENGDIVDQMSYESSENGLSWSFFADLSEQWKLADPSKAIANIQSQMTNPTPANVKLSEICSCPLLGESEWIEIYNDSDEDIDLQDWQIIDASGNTKTINDFVIYHLSFGIIEWSGSLLNNSGDSVTLEAPSGDIAFEVAFEDCSEKGNSFIIHNDEWTETATATKGEENVYKSVEVSTEQDVISTESSLTQEVERSLDYTRDDTENDMIFEEIDENSLNYPSVLGESNFSIPASQQFNPENLVLGISTEQFTDVENDNHDDKDTETGPDGALNVILGGLLFIAGSGLKLIQRIRDM